ncbi:MAG: ATP-binding protein, partial [Pseudomonadota bacterium]
VLVGPAMVLHDPRRWRHLRGLLSVEAMLQAAALAVIGYEVFGRFANAETHFFYLMFLPLAWVTTRHGQQGATLALAATFVAPLATDWIHGHEDHAVIELQIRLFALSVTSLLLGAMVSERHTAQTHMMARQTELAHVQRLNVGWEMASALAHELNQPLTAAMNYCQASLRILRANPADAERACEVLSKGIDRIERAGEIIHGLRDFMRKGDVRRVRMTVAEVVEDALRLVVAEANDSGVILHAGGLAGLPAAMADRTQVVQVLVNLARNAIQAIATSGIGGTVAISARVGDEGLEVTVADDGPGLDDAVAARLFEPFVTTKDVGMGLGLSISKSILETNGGRLWAEQGAAGGTVFRFTLPLAEEELTDA